jgi:peptidylprolyl isomerase
MNPRIILGALALLALPAAIACGGDDDDDPADLPTTTRTATTSATTVPEGSATPGGPKLENSTVLPSGVEYRDEVVGTGATPRLDQQVTVHYTGKLASNGQVFDSSIGKQPLTLLLSRFVPGFAEGVSTMKVGGKRTIYIPAELAYGSSANGPIPANSDLIFEVELVAVK